MSDDIRPDWLLPLEDRRNEIILRAAFDTFVEKGIHGATMLEIATRAKVSKETLYARFDNKDGLVFAIMGWGSRQAAIEMDVFKDEALADPAKALTEFAVSSFKCMLKPENVAMYRLMVAEAARRPEIGAAHEELFTAPAFEALGRIKDALNASGGAEIDDLEEFSESFVGVIGAMRHRALMGVQTPTEAEVEARVRQGVARLLRAYAPRSEPAALRKAG